LIPNPRQSRPDRRPIKAKHEAAYINAFIEWHSRVYRSRYRVISRPEPPDAIIQSGSTISWVEVGDVFWSDAWARDQYSYATPGETHRPIHSGVHSGMDEQFADRFVRVLQDKLTKKSYRQVVEQYGPGYLVLPMMSPFFNHDTLRLMRQKWAEVARTDAGYFRGVFLAYPRASRFRRWRLAV
jgi:hypothetical protein